MGTSNRGDKLTVICRLCILPILMSVCISAADVTSFLLVDSSQETLLLGNTNCAINLQFVSTGSNFTLTAQLNTGSSLNTNNAVINVGAKTVLYTFNSTFFTETYGQYTLTLTLTPDTGTAASKQLLLYYEEPISGVQVQSRTYVLLSDQLPVTVKIQKGSNYNVTCVYEPGSSVSKTYIVQPKDVSSNITFTTPGEKIITVYVTNMISNVSAEVTVFAYYDLTGITIQTENKVLLVTDSLNISITQDPAAQVPKGSLYLNMSYGDGQVAHQALSETGGVFTPVLYQYGSPGNYTASATLYSMVDTLVVYFNVSVWEALQVTMTMPDDAAESSPVSIQLQNLPSCIFSYNITLGNGDTLTRSSDVTASPSYTYSTSGTFNVTVIAWTPAQLISLTHTVTIHPLCDVVSLIKQGQQSINLEMGENGNISFTFECNSTKLTFEAVLDTGTQLDTSSAVINYSAKTVTYVLQSSSLVQSYGQRKINFTLTPFNGALKTIQIDLYYEEPVEGLSINVPYYVVIGEPVDLGLSLTTGSNIIVQQCLNNAECVSSSYLSKSEDLSQNVTLSTSGEHTISVTVSNALNTKNVTKTVFGIRRLNGLNITLSDDTIETTDILSFTVTCDGNAIHPMGDVKLNLTFCGNNGKTYNVGSDFSTLAIPDYIISENCSVQGDYNVDLILYNPVDSLTFPFNVRIWDQISVKLDFISTEKVFTGINFTLTDTPPSNFYFFVDYGDGNVYEPTVDVNQPFNIEPWTQAYNNPGGYDVNFTAWNNLYRVTTLHSVTILPRDVTMFDMATGESATLNLTEGGQTAVNLQFTSDAYDYVFTAELVGIGDILANSTFVINNVAGSATYTLSSAYVNQPFGQYDVNLTLAPVGGSGKSLIVTINYEETISGLAMDGSSFLPVGDSSELKVQLSTASNIDVVWTFAPSDVVRSTYNGTVREVSCHHTFASDGIYSVTLYVSNSLSEASLSVNITVIYKLNGFAVDTVTDVVATSENVTIVPKLSPTASLSMGTLSLKADYGDGTAVHTLQLNSYISDMKNELYNVNHVYNTQGNYTINVTIENEIDNQVFLLSVYIWEPLSVTLTSVSEVKVFSPVEFDFVNASNSGFYFRIEYGDNNVKENPDSSTLYNPFNVDPWNYTYNDPGTFHVTFHAWNEYYHTSNQYYIAVIARDVIALDIQDGRAYMLDLVDGFSVGVALDYVSDAFAYNLTATLNTGDELDTSSAVINQISSVVSYNITSSMVNAYGTYGVDLTLDPYGGASKTIELVIFYEEPISGFSISRYPFVPINESFLFTITFVTGSNVQVEWFLEDMCLTDFPGIPRTVYHNYTFTIPGIHNVTAVAENAVGSAFGSMLIYTYYRINGFTFISANATVQTTEYYYFTVYLNASALQPMGTLKVNMSYGDGHYEIIGLNANITSMQTIGVFIPHMYTIQGNYTATAEIFTEIDTQIFSFDVYIWDKLEMILTYPSAAKVKEVVTFDFINPPNSGFHFYLDYDDRKVLDRSNEDLFSSYSVTPWTHKFKTNNIYNMTLRAWNDWYTISCPYVITIQYPIPASSVILLPVADEIPVPDGIVIFNMTLIEDEISPTDVFCTYDYHDNKDENVSTAIDYGVSIITSYNYTFGGEKHVNFSCWNLVSSMVKRSYIMVREFTVEDFQVTYQNPVNMNMTIAETTPTGEHDLDVKAIHIPVNTTFYVSLFNCSRFPPDVYFTWNFDDGTVETDLITDFDKPHQFDRRGTYSISIDILDERTQNQTRKIYSITMGVIEFTVDPMVGIVDVHTFTFNAHGIMGSAEYKFDSYSNETMHYVSTTNPAEATVMYTLRGSYLVSVVGHNSTLQETVYLEKLVKIDFSIDNQLNMTLSNLSVYMPPGELNITMSLTPNAERKPEVMCVLHSGDLIDTGSHTEVRNITVEEPLEFFYNYLTLGYHVLQINCSNLASNTYFKQMIDVFNPCFTRDGIFDRQYSKPEKAMKSLTSVPTQLTSRMGVLCGEKEASFQWTIWPFDTITQKKGEIIKTAYTSRSTFIFTPGMLPQGVYYIRLNVSLDGTWLSEFTYIELEKPPPIAYIIGGAKTTARIIARSHDVDALTGSFDPDCGYGCNEGFTFTFNCSRVDTADFDYIDSSANNGSFDGECSTYNVSRGILRLNVSEGLFGYIVTVVVKGGNKESQFVQYIKVIEGEPPDVVPNCTLNCFEKVAIQSPMIMEAWCKDCLPWERPYYTWNLEKYNNDTGKYEALDNFHSMVSTSLNEVSVVINANQLEEGTIYSLILEASADGRNGTTVAIQELYTNYPAYGGSCHYHPVNAFAAVDFFQIHCTNWKDEGINLWQNETRDMTAEEPLMYLYEAVKDCEEDGVTVVERTELYRGGESTLINITLPVGCAAKGYMLRLNVRICDRFGDCTIDGRDVTVKEDPRYSSLDGDNTTALEALFTVVQYTYNITNAGGNDITLVRLICSSASLIFVNESAVATPVTADDILSGNVEELNETTVTALDTVKTEKLEWLSISVTKAVGADNSSTTEKEMSPADAQQAMRALESCVQKANLVTNTVINNAAQSAIKLLGGIRNKALQNPYPMQDITSMDSTIAVAVNVIGNALGSLIPDSLQDLEEEMTAESIFEDLKLQNSVLLDPQTNASTAALIEEDLWRKANLMYQLKSKERAEQIHKAEEAEKSVPKLIVSVEYLQTAKMKTLGPGGPAVLLQKKGLHISLQKINVDKISNTSQAPVGGIEIEFEDVNSNTTNSTGTVEVKQSVFDKPPQMYGKGPASLTSKAIMFSTNSDIIPNLKIPNTGVVHSRRYKPVVDAKDPDGLIYLQYNLANDGDACIIYVKPVDFSINDYADATLYRLYAKSLSIPSSSSFDYEEILDRRAWTTNGFKVFIHDSLLKKGKAFLGLKPLGVTSSVTEAPSMTTSSPSRRKRAAVLGTTGDYMTTDMTTASIETTIAPQYVPSDVEFDLIIATTGCRSWDESQKAWVSDGCVVLPISDLNSTVCRCPESPGNMFATTFVAPNTIDFSTVWGKFDAENAAVYGTILGLLFVYFIGILILRRKDKRDLIKWQTHFLCDSDSSDCYFYLLTVHTGLRRGAGTKSSVQFVLTGEDLDSGVRMLSDGVNEGFETASVRTFFMGTQEPLGELKYLRIWHDNSGAGESQSWYLNSLTVDDVQTNVRHVFMCGKWLAFDEDDGMIERILPTCGVENMTKFNTLFSQHTQFNITENHLWLSIVIRPQKSIFTRVQRLSCLLALLFLTMIANAMFFRSSDEEQVTADQVQVGFMRFSMTTLYISFIGILITTPPILFVTYVYKNCKPKPKPASANKTDKSLLSKLLRRTNPKTERAETHEVAKPKGTTYEDFYTVGSPKLPYWTIYIAWTIVALAVVVSAFFLILYSMEWGKDKAEEWLTTFIFSFLESLIFVDPMKVIVIAVLFALLFKKPVNDDKPVADVEKLRSAAAKCNSGSLRTYLDFWNDIFVKTQSCSKDHLDNMRIRREQEMKAMDTLMTIILYTVFAFVLYSISYIERDQRSYNLKANVDNFLYSSSKSQFGFTKVSNTSAYIHWLNDTFVPTYYPQDNFNGKPLTGSDLKWFKDLSNVQVGPGRLRQVRTPKEKCHYDRLTWSTPCVENYRITDQEEGSYCVGWKQYTDAECGTDLYRATYITADAWKYVPADEIWGVPIAGVYDTYAGGGYILKFTKNYETAQLVIKELADNNWIDRSTRAVFLEFTLYNANTNLFIYAIFLTEFPDTGGVFTWIQTQTFRPILSLGAMGTYAILCYVLFIIQLLYTTVTIFMAVRKIGLWRFVKVAWNVIDTLCVIMSYLAIAMFCCRIIYANQAMQMLYDDRLEGTNKFINFQHIVIWDSVYNVLIGILVFIVTIRFLRILGYNKRFTQLAAVVTGAAEELSGFSIVFGIVFLAYVLLGHLLFGNTLKEYKGIYTSWASLTNALIGKNSLDSMIRAAPEMAQLFYFTYVFCIVMTLMTMFAAILNQSISDVKSNIQNEPETYGVTDVIKNSLMSVIGIFYKKKGNTAPKKAAPSMMNHGKNFEVDAPNILRFVRGTFDDIGDKEDSENEDSKDDQSKDEILFQSRPQTSMSTGVPDHPNSPAIRAETPGEIQFALDDVDDCAIQNKSEYLAFL